jgi:hypothetical protein
MRVNISGDVRAVLRDIGFTVPAISRKAQVTALNKTSAKIGTQFRRALARETKVKQKDFKGQVKQFRATANRMSAKTWFGQRRGIQLAKLSNNPTNKFDALAAPTLFGKSGSQAWKATAATGSRREGSGRMSGFFVREGRRRLPISLVRVSFETVGEQVMRQAVSAVGPDEFRQQYIYDMRRRLARTNRSSRRSGNRRRR